MTWDGFDTFFHMAGGVFRFPFCVPSSSTTSQGGQGGLTVRFHLVEVAAPWFGPRSALWRKMLILHILSAAGRGYYKVSFFHLLLGTW